MASISMLGLLAVLIVGCSSGCSFGSPVDGQAGGPDGRRGIARSSFDGQAGGLDDSPDIVELPSDGHAERPDNPTVNVHADGRDGPQEGAPVFQSNWSTALGTSDNAQSDGGKWERFFCGSRQIMEVVPGAEHGWTLTPNILQITNQGPQHCRNVENGSAIPQTANDYYIRMYIRVTNLRSGFAFHPVSMGTVSPIGAVYWGIGDVIPGSSYAPRLALNERVGLSEHGYAAPRLSQNAWYRFEFHVEYFDPANPHRYRVWPRIYDMSGTLVGDANTYMSNMWEGPSLAQHYASGGYGTVTSRDRGRVLQVGYEGTAGNNDVGGRWFYAGVEVRTDGFPGPIQ